MQTNNILILLQSQPKFTSPSTNGQVLPQLIPDAPYGNTAYRVTSQGSFTILTPQIPISPTSDYKIKGYIRNMSPNDQPRGTYYIGVWVYDWQYKDIMNGGCYWYYFVSGVEGCTLNDKWKYFSGLIGKQQGRKFPQNGRFMRLGFFVNYGDTAACSTYEVSSCRIFELQ